MENNTQTSSNNNSKKLILTAALLGVAAIFAVILTTSNGKDTKVVSTSTGTTLSGSTASGQVAIEDVYLVYTKNDIVFNQGVLSGFTEVGKKFNQNIIPTIDTDPLVSGIIKAAGDKVYYPMFVFKNNSPNIKFSEIPKESVYVDESRGLFAIKEPILLNLPKIVYPRNAEINALLGKFERNVRNVNADTKSYVLAVEDPLCPYCSQSYLDPATKEAIGDRALKHVYFPLPIAGHENSKALIGLMNTNPESEVLDTIFKNQDAFTKIKEADVKKTLQWLLTKNKSKIKLKEGKPYTEAEVDESKQLLMTLGVLGTPTYFIITEKEVTLVGSLNMIKEILK